ncbi:MAG: Asp-tRNA(Asn)/Glu-tRNA(Gln) amidotransferase subunit GatA [Negativicutes bacterium]|nr:Asp-tRNA(Asn)/Glu-tRNA(Gln) amidotransferase subunit GatA [Negativicutes bacterium]
MTMPYYSIGEIHTLLVSRETSAEALCRDYLERIEKINPEINAYITTDPDGALNAARAVDRLLAAGEDLHPLAGVPAIIKDNICTRMLRTTCGSRILGQFVPPYSATVVERVNAVHGVILGKGNMDEFGMGSSNENSAFGPARNPWDPTRVTGGSSGGPAAAVAANIAVWGLGSDTGGSIRTPASFCGVVGMKPTYGRVSRYGLVAYASSLDQIGPFAASVEDVAIAMNCISGYDPADSTSARTSVPDFCAGLKKGVRGLKIGLPREYFGEGIRPEVSAAVMAAAAKLSDQGAECTEISLPHTEYALAAYYIIAPAEASSNLARYDGVSYGSRIDGDDIIAMSCKTRSRLFGMEVQRRIMLGTYVLSSGYYDAYYLRALKIRRLIKGDFDRAFASVDAIIAPVVPDVAFRIGEKTDDPLTMYMTDVCTIPVNMAGLPSLAIPCGLVDGLPVGLQIIGRPMAEAEILQIGHCAEQIIGFAGIANKTKAGAL